MFVATTWIIIYTYSRLYNYLKIADIDYIYTTCQLDSHNTYSLNINIGYIDIRIKGLFYDENFILYNFNSIYYITSNTRENANYLMKLRDDFVSYIDNTNTVDCWYDFNNPSSTYSPTFKNIRYITVQGENAVNIIFGFSSYILLHSIFLVVVYCNYRRQQNINENINDNITDPEILSLLSESENDNPA